MCRQKRCGVAEVRHKALSDVIGDTRASREAARQLGGVGVFDTILFEDARPVFTTVQGYTQAFPSQLILQVHTRLLHAVRSAVIRSWNHKGLSIVRMEHIQRNGVGTIVLLPGVVRLQVVEAAQQYLPQCTSMHVPFNMAIADEVIELSLRTEDIPVQRVPISFKAGPHQSLVQEAGVIEARIDLRLNMIAEEMIQDQALPMLRPAVLVVTEVSCEQAARQVAEGGIRERTDSGQVLQCPAAIRKRLMGEQRQRSLLRRLPRQSGRKVKPVIIYMIDLGSSTTRESVYAIKQLVTRHHGPTEVAEAFNPPEAAGFQTKGVERLSMGTFTDDIDDATR